MKYKAKSLLFLMYFILVEMVGLTGIEPVVWLCNPLKSLSLFFLLDSTRHPFVYFFTVNMIIWFY